MVWVIISVLLLVTVVFVAIIIYDTQRFVLRNYLILSQKIQKDCKIVLLADLHNSSFGKQNENLIKAIKEQSPDLILIAGDLLTARPGHDFSVAIDLLKELCPRYPVFYGVGNHEYRLGLYPKTYGNMDAKYREALSKVSIDLMENTGKIVEEYGIRISGLSIDREFYRRRARAKMMPDDYLEQKLGPVDPNYFEIVLAHNPLYFPAYAKWNPDLVLSGHVHGGIMKLPILGGVISPNLTLFPHFDGGLFREGDSTMIISRGLGTHTLPIRVFNPGELVVIELKKEN